MQRELPTSTNEATNETIHFSVSQRSHLSPAIHDIITKHPELVSRLLPLEEEIKQKNVFVEGKYKSLPENEVSDEEVHQDLLTVARNTMKRAVGLAEKQALVK